MSGVTVRNVEEIASYEGEHAIAGIKFRYAARELGITAWGMNVVEMAPRCQDYPEHDHTESGQEEVYVILRGSGTLHAEGDSHALAPGSLVRVGPDVKRKIISGPDGCTVLAIGAAPGKAYEPAR